MQNPTENSESATVKTNTPSHKHVCVRWMIAPASIVLIFAMALFLGSYFTKIPKNSLKGQVFASIGDIPITKIGINVSRSASPTSLYMVEGEFYFETITRWVGNTEQYTTLEYFTLFRYNPQNGECTAVTDEQSFIDFVNGRWVYAYWDVYPYEESTITLFTNNTSFTNERKLMPPETSIYANLPLGEAYVEQEGQEIRLEMKDDGKEYTIVLDSFETSSFQVVGVVGKKVFLVKHSWDEAITNTLCCVNLENSQFSNIMIDGTPVPGEYAYIGEDNYVYIRDARDNYAKSKVIRVDPATDNAEVIAQIEGEIQQFFCNGEYVVYRASSIPFKGMNIYAVKLQ